jgi:hypothetical protein
MSEKKPLREIVAELDPDYGRLRLRRLSEVRSRSVRFLVPGLVPLKANTLLAGIGGLGKSTLAACWAAGETRGFYDDGTPHDVVYVSYEDTAEEVWRPRVLAANGEPSRVIEVRVALDDGGVVVLPKDIASLERVVRDHDVRLVVVDPVVAAIDVALDTHKDQHVRSVLAKLTKTAEDTGAAVVGIGHLNKDQSTDAYLRVANSMAFWNAARSVILVTEDPDDDECRLVSQVKANWSRSVGVQRWQVEPIVLPDEIDATTGRAVETSRLVFVDFAEGVHPGDVLRADLGGEKAQKAAEFLAEELADGEWHESAELKVKAEALGVSERTLKRAARDLGYEYEKRDFPMRTVWRLPIGPETVGPATGPPPVAQPDEPVSEAGSRPAAPTIGPPGQAPGEGGPTGAPARLANAPEWERAWHARRALRAVPSEPDEPEGELSAEEAAAVARYPELFPQGTPVAQVRAFLPSVLAAEAKGKPAA